MKLGLFKRLNKLIILLLILISTEPLFAKETVKLPQDIQDYISSITASKSSWYIRKASSSKAGKVIYGPFETKEQALCVWLYFDLADGKGQCIAKNESFITRTPTVFYRKEITLLKEQIIEYGNIAVLNYYFLKEEFPVLETQPVPAAAPAEEPAQKPVTESVPASEPVVVTEQKTENKSEEPKAVSVSEEASKKEPEQNKEPAAESLSVTENKKTETTKQEEQFIAQKEETADSIIPQPVEKIERYKKEYLQDYAPVKTAPLPTDEEEIVEYKVENPDAKDANGRTLLMKASENGNDWEISNLIKSGANVNLTDNDGWTALMYAVRYQQNIVVVRSLINAGAQIKVKNNYGLSALLLAATYNDNPEILKLIVSKYSISEKELLQSFIQVLSSNTGSEYSTSAKVQIYIDMGIPLNVFYQGKTPLMYAASYTKSTKIIKLLLQNGAQTAIRSTEGRTAFDYAAENKALAHDEYYWALNQK